MTRAARRPALPVRSSRLPAQPRRGSTASKSIFVNEPGIDAFLRRVWPGAQIDSRLNDPFREDTRIYSAVMMIVDAALAVPMRVYTGNPAEDDEAELVPDSDPVAQLLSSINPTMDAADLKERMALGMEVTGGVYWFLMNGDGTQVRASDPSSTTSQISTPEEIWPASQDAVEAKVDPKTNMPIGYFLDTGTGRPRYFDASSVVHFRYPSARGGLEGVAPLHVALERARQIRAAMLYQDSILENGGDPGGVVLAKNMDAETAQRFQQMLDERWNGGQAGDTRVLPGDLDYKQNTLGPKDMEFETLHAVNQAAISEVFRVPEALLMGGANYAEHRSQLRVFWTLKMIPLFRRWENTINQRLIPRLRDARAHGHYVAFDLSVVEALQGELSEQVETAERLTKIGVPLDQALRMAKIETDPIEGGEIALVAGSLKRLTDYEESDEPDDDAPTPPAFGDDDEPDEPEGDDGDEDAERALQEQLDAMVEAAVEDAAAEAEEAARAAYADRRAYERSTEERRKKSDNRIAARVRRWRKRMEEAQIAHLDKIARGRKTAPHDRELMSAGSSRGGVVRLSSGASALAYRALEPLTRGEELNGEFDAFLRRHPDLRGHDPEDILYSATLNKTKLTDAEVTRLVLAASQAGLWEKQLRDILEDSLEQAFRDSLRGINAELGTSGPLDLDSRRAQEFLSRKLIKVSEGVNSTVAKDLKRILVDVFAKGGEVSGSLADRLRSVLPDAKKGMRRGFRSLHSRARTIARTETAQVDSFVREEAMKDAEIEQHEWITIGDDLVRPAHASLDGEIRDIGDAFSTPDGPMLRAHDPSGPASQVINCRCVMRPVITD